MKAQYDNKLMSSFVLWLDHTISNVGSGYYQRLIQFYPDKQLYNGLYSYNSPFPQIISDSSLPGAYVQTGIVVNSSFIPVGQGGLSGIDYNNGRFYSSVFFTGDVSMNSGHVKEIPVKMTSEPETKLLFETKYEHKPKTENPTSGLASDAVAYPVVFVRGNASRNEPWQFGGTENTYNYIRAIAFCDSQFQLDAVLGIMRDQIRGYVPILEESEFPYDSIGWLRTNPYNYNTLTANKVAQGDAAFVDEVYISKFNQNSFSQSITNLNPNVYVGIVDFEVCKPRDP